MTHEEAIEVIKANYPSQASGMLRKALDLAIARLEAVTEAEEQLTRVEELIHFMEWDEGLYAGDVINALEGTEG
ncbi:hypothetical protein LD13_gp147 [Bacillus phage Bobb]|uniref:Uncharacterized protein n=1 Tax=Bacillus phage Bobb TaxID=1527469 RepID=A0A076G8X3_9CAUD|nr:hypothetical protein LD13_gp147 [Bacillus phage Bobb]AII28048.1 hypothetical protein [Bacillus phage Bobb]